MSETKLNGYRYDPRIDPEVAPLLRHVDLAARTGPTEQMVDRMLAEFPGAAGIDGLRGRLPAIAREHAARGPETQR